jgi:hypothetical protein
MKTLCHALGTMQRIEHFRPCPDCPMSMHLIRWVSLYPGAAGLCTPNAGGERRPKRASVLAVRSSALFGAALATRGAREGILDPLFAGFQSMMVHFDHRTVSYQRK